MAEERIQTVSTRMSLKLHEQKLKSVQKGFSLLKCKSDALQIKCKELEEIVKEKDSNIKELFKKAFSLLEEAEMYGFDQHIYKKICLESQAKVVSSIEQVCGVSLANFKLEQKQFNGEILWKGGYKLKELKNIFDNLISTLVDIGSVKNSLNVMKSTFEVTNKRKNSLEHKMIPVLENTVLYIESELDESEREEFFRLKKIQSMKNRAN